MTLSIPRWFVNDSLFYFMKKKCKQNSMKLKNFDCEKTYYSFIIFDVLCSNFVKLAIKVFDIAFVEPLYNRFHEIFYFLIIFLMKQEIMRSLCAECSFENILDVKYKKFEKFQQFEISTFFTTQFLFENFIYLGLHRYYNFNILYRVYIFT